MNTLERLKEFYDYANYNLLCYSKNYLMNEPKEEFENQWNKEKENVKLFEKLIKEEKKGKM